jgi:hypothetical protein
VFSKKLVAPFVIRLSLPAYLTKEAQLTVGPLEWKNLYGVTMMHYYLLKATNFHFDLDPEGTNAGDGAQTPVPSAPAPQGSKNSEPAEPGTVPASSNSTLLANTPEDPSKHARVALTNADVITMVKAGITPETILVAIQKGPNEFDTSPAGLIELKRQGVPESIVQGMLRAGTADSGDASPKPHER